MLTSTSQRTAECDASSNEGAVYVIGSISFALQQSKLQQNDTVGQDSVISCNRRVAAES